MSGTEKKYKRILFKLSGEFLLGSAPYGIDNTAIQQIARDIQEVVSHEYETCVVIGGGNIFRGVSGASQGMDRATADYMGMLATVMNALALANALQDLSVPCRVVSGIVMPSICEPYYREKCLRHLEKKRVIIFAAGSGNPYFTTDTAAALRASEMNCEVLLKGTKVAGVYEEDPIKNPQAQYYPRLTYHQVLSHNLQVMDMAAVSIAQESNLPIYVFSIKEKGGLLKTLQHQNTFSIIASE